MGSDELSHIKEVLRLHKRRLWVLEGKEALQGLHTPPEVLIEIDELRERIARYQSQIENYPREQEMSQTTGPSDTVRKQIEITFNGSFDHLTPETQSALVRAVAAMADISPDQVVVLKVIAGSVILFVQVPNKAATTLLQLFASGDEIIEELGIQNIQLVSVEVENGPTANDAADVDVNTLKEEIESLTHQLDALKNALEKEQAMRNQLVQADKLAALGKMVSVIAHEINNPIQTVKNTLSLLEDQIIPSTPAVEYLKMASTEANRISDLVAQLRATYASRSKAMVLVNVLDLLDEVHDLLTPQLKMKHVEWYQVNGSQPYTVLAVRNNLKQVFINLCLNAMEAMEAAQGGKLTISLHNSADGQRVGVGFHNTGPLISDEVLSLIFDPFFTTKKTGSGLGLSISSDIIQQHQGEIIVESAPGKGVTFTVWLPLAPVEEDAGR